MTVSEPAMASRSSRVDAHAPDSREDARRSSLGLLYGTDESLPDALALQAGPLRLALVDGALRDLLHGDDEVWHAVTFPLRDPDWWTPPFIVEASDRTGTEDGFRVELRGRFATEPSVAGRLSVVGRATGSVRIEAEAVPTADTEVNRLGLCLLYPTGQGGAECEILHDDGRVSRSTFPTLVPAWPPFMGIRGIRHEYAPGRWASCRFEGDSFEFEDQRNNADASFKVYSRSNLMPRPYRLRAGEPVRQAIELALEAPVASRVRTMPLPHKGLAAGPDLPRLGLAVPASAAPDRVAAIAGAMRPDYLHVDLDADGLDAAFVAALVASGLPLQLDLGLADDPEGRMRRARAALDGVPIEAVALFPAGPDAVREARCLWSGIPMGGGTRHYFAQINRIEGLGPIDFQTFTVSPLVHGADDASVMASPRSLPGMVATLAFRRPGLPVRIGPSALAMRASPIGRLPGSDGTRRMAMGSDDPRARGLFGAAWALAMMAEAAKAGVAALTLMALDGPSSVATGGDAALLWHPVSAILARLAGAPPRIETPLAVPPCCAALAFRRGTARELIVANLAAVPHEMALPDWARGARCAILDEEAIRAADPAHGPPAFREVACASRLALGPYGVASLVLEHDA